MLEAHQQSDCFSEYCKHLTIKTLKCGSDSRDSVLKDFNDYCKEHSIHVSPLIVPQRYPGRGIGIYAAKSVKKGEKLTHIPAKALFTSQSVPKAFLPKTARKQLTVHCLLAAYLAFGKDDDLAKHRRWMATWPTLEDFTESMPVFWLQDLRGVTLPAVRDENNQKPRQRANKRRKTFDRANGQTPSASTRPADTPGPSSFTLSPGVDNIWLTLPHPTHSRRQKSALAEQASKIRACLTSVDRCFPDLQIFNPASTTAYLKFLHMWSCVNTRCFYHLQPGQAAPEDSNEAIALCPLQDLFNHTDAPGCHVEFDRRGSYVTADRDYEAGEELFLSYGRHSNDVLWVEYGFTMPHNGDDHLKIDPVVLSGVDPHRREMLADAGYLGDYTLDAAGVCYRTLVASYLTVLPSAQWRRMIAAAGRGFDPDTHPPHKLRARQQIVDWILAVRAEAAHNLRALRDGGKDERALLAAWVTGTTLTHNQQAPEAQVRLARARLRMCTARWAQVFDVCVRALRSVEEECPGAYVRVDEPGREVGDLDVDAARFLDGAGA